MVFASCSAHRLLTSASSDVWPVVQGMSIVNRTTVDLKSLRVLDGEF
jgi:hypothetical protein